MQRAFGADFSGVRVHSDSQSHALNSKIQARAFTTGSDIFLGKSAPSLRSRPGTGLLAHELTHVMQQGSTAQRSTIRREYIHGSAAEDVELFDKVPPVDKPLDVSPGSRAAKSNITAGNMKHYLVRHTFRYQRLNSKTVFPGAGFFLYKTTADDVKAMLDEALSKLPDNASIGTSAVSVAVDLANGLRVNVGALKGGKLVTLATTIDAWSDELLAFPTIGGASNGPAEAVNLLIENARRPGYGMRNFHNYRIRLLLTCGIKWMRLP